MNVLLKDLDLDLLGKFAVLESLRAAFARPDSKLKAQLRERYRERISGPLLDRIDIRVEASRVQHRT